VADEADFCQTRGRTEAQNVLFYLVRQSFAHFKNVALRLIFIARAHQYNTVRVRECYLVSKQSHIPMIALKPMTHYKQVHTDLQILRLWLCRCSTRFKDFLLCKLARLPNHLYKLGILIHCKYLFENDWLVLQLILENSYRLNFKIRTENVMDFWLAALLSLVTSRSFVFFADVVMFA
jgi:hypothetical protein